MNIKKVTAIVRVTSLDAVEQRLCDEDVCGFTVSAVRGIGEDRNFFKPEPTLQHARVEVFTEAGRAEAIARAIMEAAHSGEPGDGMVAILPVERVYRIRTGREAAPGDL